MKKIFTICFLFIASIGYCQKIDTLYFDKNLKGVSNKLFADGYVVTISDETSNMFRAFTIDGKPFARGSYISINKQDYTQSVFDGECIDYYANGKTKSVCNYVKGIKNGTQTDFDENGNIQFTGNYTDGDLTSLKVYYDNGELCKEVAISQGQMHGEYKEFYKDGVLGLQKTYNNGKVNGPIKYYNPDGSISYSSNMNNDIIDGEEIYYQNGHPILISNYDKGLPIGVFEDRRNGSVKQVYKEIKLLDSSDIRLSCSVYEASMPIKETGKLMAMMYGTATDVKYKSFLLF